jgi:hypothetical protein
MKHLQIGDNLARQPHQHGKVLWQTKLPIVHAGKNGNCQNVEEKTKDPYQCLLRNLWGMQTQAKVS